MDPDFAVWEMREIISTNSAANYERLAELFEGLDNWLIQGGFLPKDWVPKN